MLWQLGPAHRPMRQVPATFRDAVELPFCIFAPFNGSGP